MIRAHDELPVDVEAQLDLPADRLAELGRVLRERLTAEEARLRRPRGEPTLYGHSLRVGRIALRLALDTPGAAGEEAYLAGLLHDAGKLARLRDPCGDLPEEVHSAEVATDLMAAAGLDQRLGERVASAIRQLYRDDVDPPLTTRLVDDADNLDKLGLPGAAVFLVKQGLRGIGLGPRLLAQVGAELTYARHAPDGMWTVAGRALARPRAQESERFFRALIRAARRDGLYRFRVRTIACAGVELTAVVQEGCDCGGRVTCSATSSPGTKCTLLRVRQGCARCDWELVTELCRPRLR